MSQGVQRVYIRIGSVKGFSPSLSYGPFHLELWIHDFPHPQIKPFIESGVKLVEWKTLEVLFLIYLIYMFYAKESKEIQIIAC